MDSGLTATGGVVRNNNGDWILSNNRFLDNWSIFDAEIWGLLDDLSLLHEQRHRRVIIQSDSLEAVKVIQDKSLEASSSTLLGRTK
ncbi:hypothetical protein Goshw_012381 [Gossypium schwendimanii]|uniref:RNase H type-1 domain-containing protein n=1 Tax=Gossypium schwendimanii TaxID=34291 RepID=A0A7J9LVL0_GOSSC|nr:hypothetical protein [Gossypium schwendimanii]